MFGLVCSNLKTLEQMAQNVMCALIVSESNNWGLKERVMEFSFTYIGNISSRVSWPKT
jgi:hypothetical protein